MINGDNPTEQQTIKVKSKIKNILFELIDYSLLLFNLISEATQLFVMNLSVVLHLFLQSSLQNMHYHHYKNEWCPALS